MFAVIKTGGKQYVVKEGDVLQIEKLGVEAGRKILIDTVLLIEEGEKTLIGTPFLENAVIRAEILKNLKAEKVLVFKKKRRKQFRRTRGHRQPLTEIRIERIIADKSAVPAEVLTPIPFTLRDKKRNPLLSLFFGLCGGCGGKGGLYCQADRCGDQRNDV